MITVERDAEGKPIVWCDPEIAAIVAALNKAGIRTVASCSGHGHRPASIALESGEWIVVVNDTDRRRIDALFPTDINGDTVRHPPMRGKMLEADFPNDTLTFQMEPGYYAAAGRYEIIRETPGD